MYSPPSARLRRSGVAAFLLLLLVAGSRPARVRAGDSQSPDLSADENGDGVVSGRERRRKRRADRRARRAARGLPPDPADETDEAADAAATDEASHKGTAAAANATSAAGAMKDSMTNAAAGAGFGGGAGAQPGSPGGPSNGAGGGPGGAPAGGAGNTFSGGPGGGGFTPSAFGAGASGDPAHPKAPADFVLAARSGYSPAFAKAGLKLGPDGKSVVRLDGSPATAADYARLQQEISSMPAALGRRSDFFSAVSPEHYADLKHGIKDPSHSATVYKDVGTTEKDRDFVHTASCDKLSGDCNKSVEKPSYKKGDYVAPEDLDRMWDALQKELDSSKASDDKEAGPKDGMPSLGGENARLARDAAMSVALGGSGETAGGKASVAGGGAAKTSTPAGVAAAATSSVKRLWKAVVLGMPGQGGRAKSGAGLLAIIAGGASLLGLAGFVILRRKG